MPSIKKKIEEEHGRKLTNRQMTFAQKIVEGIYSNAECARKAGYSPDVAPKQASILLNGRDYPHVLEYITELRQERERRYGVTTIGQLERLHQLISWSGRGRTVFGCDQRGEDTLCPWWFDHRQAGDNQHHRSAFSGRDYHPTCCLTEAVSPSLPDRRDIQGCDQ